MAVLTALPAHAQVVATKPAFAIPAAELLATKLEGAPTGLDVEVILDEHRFTFDEHSRMTTEHRLVYRVHTKKGAESWAGTSATYHPWRSNKPEIKARVITRDGREHWLKPAALVDSAASQQRGAIYSDERRLSGPLPAMDAGAMVEEQIVIREHRPYFEAGRVRRSASNPGAFTHLRRVVIDAPKRLPLRYRLRGARGKPKRSNAGGRQSLTFEYRNQRPVKRWRDTSGPDVAMVPVIDFSTGKSWNAIARAYSDIVDKQLQDFDAKPIAEAVVTGDDGRMDKIRKLLAYVHAQVRYTGMELGEQALVPAKPGDTLGHHYGDCKDKATLLVGLLRSLGFDAHVALLHAGSGLDVPQKLPGMGLFNHAIVHIAGDVPLWVDATAETLAVGDLPFSDASRRALIASGNTRGLTRVTAGTAERDTYREDVFVDYEIGKPARVREVSTGTGAVAGSLRYDYRETDATLNRSFSKYVEGRFGAKLDRYEASFIHDVSEPPRLTIWAEDSKHFDSADAGGTAPAGPQGLYRYFAETLYKDEAKEESRKKREKKESDRKDARFRYLPKFPVAVRPTTTVLSYHLTVPKGYAWQGIPESLSEETAGIKVWRRVSLDDNERVLHVEHGARSETALVAVKDLPKVQQMLTRHWKEATTDVSFAHLGAAAIKQGQVREGLDRYRALMKELPNDPGTHLRFALALNELGFGADAKAVARGAATRWPKHARARWTYGYVLLFDDLGRDSYPGADFEAAERELRAALKLDPEEALYHQQLRRLLSAPRGSAAELPAKQRRELLAMLEVEQEKFGDDAELQEETVRQLLWLGDFRGARDKAEELQEGDVRNLLWVTALAGADDFEKAHQKAIELGDGDPRKLLAGAAGVLALMRHDELAVPVGLSEATLRGAKTRAMTQKTFGALRDRRKCLGQMKPAARALHDLLVEVMVRPDADPKLENLAAVRGTSHADGESVIKKLRGYRNRFSAMAVERRDLSARAMACLTAWHVDSQEGALRVRLHAPGTAPNAKSETWYLRRVGNRHVVVGARDGTDVTTVGRQAMRALRQRRLPEARAWLKWADESLRSLSPQKDRYGQLSAIRAAWPSDLATAKADALWPAAALLGIYRPMGAPEVRVFERALARETGERAMAARWGLALALKHLGRHGEAVKHTAELIETRPSDLWLRTLHLRTLTDAGRHGEVLEQLDAFASQFPDSDELVENLRLVNERRRGAYPQALARALERQASGNAEAGELNNVAWSALFYDGDLKQARQLAEEAVKRARKSSSLHTLATLEVQLSDVDQAHAHLMESVRLNDDRLGGAHEWLTLGLLADRLGLEATRVQAWKRIEPPKQPSDISSHALYLRLRESQAATKH